MYTNVILISWQIANIIQTNNCIFQYVCILFENYLNCTKFTEGTGGTKKGTGGIKKGLKRKKL